MLIWVIGSISRFLLFSPHKFFTMHKIISSELTLAVLLSLFIFSSCTDKSKMLLKTWRVENLQYSRPVPEDMKPAIENQIAEMRKNFLLTYNADGTYNTVMSNQTMQGKWKLNWNNSKIISTASNGETKDFTIMELTDNTFHFKANEGGEEVVFLMVAEK